MVGVYCLEDLIQYCDVGLWGLMYIPHRIGPEKGVIHIAAGAVNNALWDMFARARGKPLWKLVVDMTPVRPTPRCNPA